MKLEVKNYRCFSDQDPARLTLRNEPVAIVGTNNAGKSAMLRMPYELRGVFQTLHEVNLIWHLAGIQSIGLTLNGVDKSNVFCLQNDRDMTITVDLDDSNEIIPEAPNRIRIVAPRRDEPLKITLERDGYTVEPAHLEFPYSAANGMAHPSPRTIRLLKPIADVLRILAKAKYIGAERSIITQTKGEYYDIQIGTELVQTWNDWKFGTPREPKLKCRMLEERIRRAFDFKQFEIRTHSHNTALEVLINGEPFLLAEVGTGLAQYIVVGASLLIRPSTLTLIDEPESNLHPGIQGDFLEMIDEYSPNSVLYATHSLGLATTYAHDTYLIERSDNGTSSLSLRDNAQPRESFLRGLVYSGFLDVGAATVVLVEGPHDVNPTKTFLRTLGKNHLGAVLPINGDSTISHHATAYLDEVLRFLKPEQLIVLIDSEQESETATVKPERLAFKSACDERRIRCHLTKKRAFENYFTDRAVKAVKGEGHRALLAFEKLPKTGSVEFWGKPENGEIAAKMTAAEILSGDLGVFLNENIRAAG